MSITHSLKVLSAHADQVEALLQDCDCDFSLTGTVNEKCGTETTGWFISRSAIADRIGIEPILRLQEIPYDTVQHGPEFRIMRRCHFRLDENHEPQLLRYDHGDNTLELLDELETAIAGNDYTLARIFIQRKRQQYLTHLGWDTQQRYTEQVETEWQG